MGKSFAYSEIDVANRLAQDISNTHNSRLKLECDYDEVGEDLYYAVDFMVDHHNAFMERIDPVIDDNPFRQKSWA